MSTNIHFAGVRDIVVVGTGKSTTQEIGFDRVWQTPTKVTWDIIINSGDPVQGYKDYILRECSEDQEIDLFAHYDFECQHPIGKEVYNPGKEHVAEFEEWLQMCKDEGYTVTAEAW